MLLKWIREWIRRNRPNSILCEDCYRRMPRAKSCGCDFVLYDGIYAVDKIKYGQETNGDYAKYSKRCHDCGVAVGKYHHDWCDVQQCPVCFGQYLSCRGDHSDWVTAG